MKPYWAGVFPACTTQLKRDQSLDPEEKRAVVRCAVETARGRVPVLSGEAIQYVRDVENLDASGVMLMPPMSYKGDPRAAAGCRS